MGRVIFSRQRHHSTCNARPSVLTDGPSASGSSLLRLPHSLRWSLAARSHLVGIASTQRDRQAVVSKGAILRVQTDELRPAERPEIPVRSAHGPAAASSLRDGGLASAGRCHYEHYTSSHQQKRENEDRNIGHGVLHFWAFQRPQVYSPRDRATRE